MALRWTRQTAVLSLLVLTLAPGCYRYRATPMEDLPGGVSVRAHLNEQGVARLRELTGRERRAVEGELLEVDAEVLRLAVPVPADRSRLARDLRERLIVPRSHVFVVEVKELDRWRTGASLAAAALVAGAIVVEAVSGSGRSPNRPPLPGPGEGSVVSYSRSVSIPPR